MGRDELIVLGWTPPGGSRKGIGALHVGYFDPEGRLHYAGGVGTGFSERELATLRNRLTNLKAAPPDELLIAGDPIDGAIQWVRPELVVEVQYTAWSGAGRVRHPVYLGLREDKTPRDVVREVADPAAKRSVFMARPGGTGAVRRSRGWKGAIPPLQRPIHVVEATQVLEPATPMCSRIVVAKAPQRIGTVIGNVAVSHPDRQLWPGLTYVRIRPTWLRFSNFNQNPPEIVEFIFD